MEVVVSIASTCLECQVFNHIGRKASNTRFCKYFVAIFFGGSMKIMGILSYAEYCEVFYDEEMMLMVWTRDW